MPAIDLASLLDEAAALLPPLPVQAKETDEVLQRRTGQGGRRGGPDGAGAGSLDASVWIFAGPGAVGRRRRSSSSRANRSAALAAHRVAATARRRSARSGRVARTPRRDAATRRPRPPARRSTRIPRLGRLPPANHRRPPQVSATAAVAGAGAAHGRRRGGAGVQGGQLACRATIRGWVRRSGLPVSAAATVVGLRRRLSAAGAPGWRFPVP